MKRRRRSEYRSRLPEVIQAAGRAIAIRDEKIPHREILRAIEECPDFPGKIAAIYREKVLPLETRTIRLLGKKHPATIICSLLGYEVQAGYKRIQCPDHVTARYIRLFSELGCHSIKLPYDPTVTAQLIPALEGAVENITKSARQIFPDDPRLQRYVIRKIYEIVRRQIQFAK